MIPPGFFQGYLPIFLLGFFLRLFSSETGFFQIICPGLLQQLHLGKMEIFESVTSHTLSMVKYATKDKKRQKLNNGPTE